MSPKVCFFADSYLVYGVRRDSRFRHCWEPTVRLDDRPSRRCNPVRRGFFAVVLMWPRSGPRRAMAEAPRLFIDATLDKIEGLTGRHRQRLHPLRRRLVEPHRAHLLEAARLGAIFVVKTRNGIAFTLLLAEKVNNTRRQFSWLSRFAPFSALHLFPAILRSFGA